MYYIVVHLIFIIRKRRMKYTIYSVHLVDFPKGVGGELYGKHYSIILTDIKRSDNTLVVVPITSKKKGKKYRNGFTIDCQKYQKNPSHLSAFVMVDKIREISIERIYDAEIYTIDIEDIEKLKHKLHTVLIKSNPASSF